MKIENSELSNLLQEQQTLFVKIDKKNLDVDKKRLNEVQKRIGEIQKELLNHSLNVIEQHKETKIIDLGTTTFPDDLQVSTELDDIKIELKLANEEYHNAVRDNQNIYEVLLPTSRKRKINAFNKIKELREKKKRLKQNDN